MYAERLGAQRAVTLNPLAAMAAAGVVLALGSDSPVTPLDPWGTVRAAVHHRTSTARMHPSAAFAAHTSGGWAAAGRDHQGVLTVGAAATFAVWDTTEPGLPDLAPGRSLPTCSRTVVRGREVFAA
jgi:predicted amidohydrolase YtcJ